jgi:broad specificity phosphatase PhoE
MIFVRRAIAPRYKGLRSQIGMELVLVRHARPHRIELAEGPADPGLDAVGAEQATRLASWLGGEDVHAVYTSPLRRAHETASPLADALGLDARIDPGVSEWDAEASSYIPVEELKADAHPAWEAMRDERWDDLGVDAVGFVRRVVEALDTIAAAHPGQRVVVVCHAGVVNAYTASVLGLDRLLWFEPLYTSISRVLVDRDGRRSVFTLNEHAHLREPAPPSSPPGGRRAPGR